MPADHARVSEVFLSACDLAPEAVAPFLDEVCADDGELRRAVEAMLKADRVVEDPLSDEKIDDVPGPASIPKQIGPFRILGEIGRGGMGVVYEAEQAAPARRVAVKVIHPGAATPGMVSRFRRESELLGRLRHLGIAQIYEAGTVESEAGEQPYFAMELVSGSPLRRYADHHGLDLAARLELLARIADAVQHAHVNGVVHRDLKPENILVSDEPSGSSSGHARFTHVGQPKILDFGVARATGDEARVATLRTSEGQIVGTLAYMSPEQVSAARDVDARADVYALGVIGYELVSGELPFDLAGLAVPEALRRVCEDEPSRLGTLVSAARGDAETIILKAMEKQADRRYQSASEFASDIRRSLASQPITARPPSTMYQLSRFAKRNRGLVAGVAVAFVILVLGIIATSWQAITAIRAQREALATARFQEQMLSDLDQHEFGVALRQLLLEASAEESEEIRAYLTRINTTDVAVALLDEQILSPADRALEADLADQPALAVPLGASLANVYQDLGAAERAIEVWSRVRDRAIEYFGPDDRWAIVAAWRVGEEVRRLGRYDEAENLYQDAHERAVRVFGASDAISLGIELDIARLRFERGRFDGALTDVRDLYDRVLGALGYQNAETVNTGVLLADYLLTFDRLDEAEAFLLEFVPGVENAYGASDPLTAGVLIQLARLRNLQLRYEESVALRERVLSIYSARLGNNHRSTTDAERTLSGEYRNVGDLDRAVYHAESAYERVTRVFGMRHIAVFDAANDLALAYEDAGRLEDAERLASSSLVAKRELLGNDHRHTLIAINNLGMLYRNMERWEDSRVLLEEAFETRKRVLGTGHTFTLGSGFNLADTCRRLGELTRSIDIGLEVVDIALEQDSLGPDHIYTAMFRVPVAEGLIEAGRSDEARAQLVEAQRVFEMDGPIGDFAERAERLLTVIDGEISE
ncbi:MAG: serine/threonine-protein kinase [Planctomycetota bacterium]